MKFTSMALLALFSFAAVTNASGLAMIKIIDCDGQVSVFANGGPVQDMPVTIEFPGAGGKLEHEQGRLHVNSDASLIATSRSAVVSGSLAGTGYIILNPAHDPLPAACRSIAPAP